MKRYRGKSANYKPAPKPKPLRITVTILPIPSFGGIPVTDGGAIGFGVPWQGKITLLDMFPSLNPTPPQNRFERMFAYNDHLILCRNTVDCPHWSHTKSMLDNVTETTGPGDMFADITERFEQLRQGGKADNRPCQRKPNCLFANGFPHECNTISLMEEDGSEDEA